jgi:hypothetical protein
LDCICTIQCSRLYDSSTASRTASWQHHDSIMTESKVPHDAVIYDAVMMPFVMPLWCHVWGRSWCHEWCRCDTVM